ncbi:MAG TPA: hydroxymethylglutaryl-CoA lyase [Acetobacteraceae bacterium]|nr:hydroxymethylglutaryl-CoA lyase [Acetobacteraceae bacterium]
MSPPRRVQIVEVGPRDGLQNEAVNISVEAKVALVEALAAAGCKRIEAGAFVSPRWVPQMADSELVFGELKKRASIRYSALVPNIAGYERARAAGVKEIAVFGAASETFSRRNINCSINDSLQRFWPVVEAARADGVFVRGYASCALGCPYEGRIAPPAVVSMCRTFIEMGCSEVAVSDTIGAGTPTQARDVVARVADAIGLERVAVHFHDTYGQALANIYACLQLGVATIDGAVAGLGGCPYAKGASGNVASEDIVYMLHGMGIETGINLEALCAAGNVIATRLGRESGSRVGRALWK